MANTTTALNPTLWQSTVQDYLVNMLVARDISQTKFDVPFGQMGAEIEFPELSDVYIETYTPGSDMTEQPIVATSSKLLIDKFKDCLLNIQDPEKIQSKADYQIALSKQIAYQLANDIDATVLKTITSASGVTSLGSLGTLDASSILQATLDADTTLFRQNAYSMNAQKFAVVGPKFKNLMASSLISNGFNTADATLRNGFVGKYSDFDVYVSNNLPSSQAVTIATNPTAGDTITLFGVTWTFRASASAAGEITIGVAASNTQTNVTNALTGSGTGYVDVSQENRARLKNAQLAISTWGSDLATITGAGYIGGSAVFTSANNFWGTETTKLIYGVKGAVALAVQKEPEIESTPIPKQKGVYLKGFDMYGTKVFSRSVKRLVIATVNA